jgi:signal transduction histidine kinase
VLAAPPAAAQAAAVPLGRIGGFRFAPEPGKRITTEGIVTFVTRELLFLQENGRGVRVGLAAGSLPAIGDRVRVSGFLDFTRQIVGLRDATFTPLGRDTAPEPIAVDPAEVVRMNEQALRGRVRADPMDYEGTLVTFPARLVEARPHGDGGELLLSSGSLSLPARLDEAEFAKVAGLAPGSGLEVRGICEVHAVGEPGPLAVASLLPPVEIAVLLRSAADVKVVAAAPWWTPRRLAAVLAAALAVLAAALVWAWLLRREVAAKTGLLAREMRMRRDAAIEFEASLRERNRLAANLHDTLLQTLVGIDYQLGACGLHDAQATAGTTKNLGIARDMLAHATRELRQSVWALRTIPLDGDRFDEAVAHAVDQVSQGHPETVRVRTEGAAFVIPKFVAGNLAMVVQEAVRNALQHAGGTSIDVLVAFDQAAQRVAVAVRDDGRGFEVGGQPGLPDGHFGIQGMRERIERLGGTCTIESHVGGGTTVRADVPLRKFDPELEA